MVRPRLASPPPDDAWLFPRRQAEIDAQFGIEAETDTDHMVELFELDTVDPRLLLPLLGEHCEGV